MNLNANSRKEPTEKKIYKHKHEERENTEQRKPRKKNYFKKIQKMNEKLWTKVRCGLAPSVVYMNF